MKTLATPFNNAYFSISFTSYVLTKTWQLPQVLGYKRWGLSVITCEKPFE